MKVLSINAVLLGLVFFLSGCVSTPKVEPSLTTKKMAVAALSDLSDHVAQTQLDRNHDRYWFVLDSKPAWILPYAQKLFKKRNLNLSDGDIERLRVSNSGKVFVPVKYAFEFSNGEWISVLDVSYPDEQIKVTRVYSTERPLTSAVVLVRQKETQWQIDYVEEL